MHFFKNSVSFIAVMCVCGAGFAATPRVGMTQASASAASRRLASLSNVVKSTTVVPTSTSSTSSSSNTTVVLSDTDCIDDYRSCMKGENACGSDFSECTTNVLFHGHMSECFSTLYQCSSTAINSLFGTSNVGNLSAVAKYVPDTKDTEVERYAYPTDGSIMGMDIIGAATRNKLSTGDCVKKYKNCLSKDNICGEDFELCTSEDEFKKQAVMCDSILSRCQKEGFQQLFGEKQMTKPANNKLKPIDGDTLRWVTDGATLAAANAVNTCYKVIDSCFINACSKNPYRCVEGVSFGVLGTADFVADQTKSTSVDTSNATETQTASSVRKFFRAACQDTIGANKYCYMTFKSKTPSKSDLSDPDTREEIFDEAYSTRNKKDIIGVKVTEMVEKFDKTAKDKCIETFKSCSIRSCGGGSGAACYSRVFGTTKDMSGSINKGKPYQDIVRGCSAAVNTDANCKYMAATQSASGYNYKYSDDGAFDELFPQYKNTGDDKLPVVAALNADLSTAYNDVAIAQLKKQCGNVVSNCVKSMCGANYQNCYRNRNDISLATYNTTSDSFNKSMNKVGGVLDYTIVQGLCASTVKNSDVCAESLSIAKMGIADGESDVTTGWGSNTNIGSAWRSSANDQYTQDVQEVNQDGKHICECGNSGTAICDYEEGGTTGCSTPHMVSKSIAQENSAVNSVFKDVLVDVEMEAQAQYKAKLTKEQNICLAQNSGANPNATFVWAKLKGKIKSDYSAKGLGENGSVPSNDLYNSFCRVKVSVMSEDKDVQNALGGESYAYYSTGDAFTCGSWISDGTIDSVTKKVGDKARKEAGEGSRKDKNVDLWVTLGSSVLGGGLATWGMDALQNKGTGLGGLLNKNLAKAKTGSQCADLAREARKKYDAAIRTKDQSKMNQAVSAASQAKTKLASINSDAANKITVPVSVVLESYDTDVLEKAGQEAIAAQDAEYTLDPDSITALTTLIGDIDAKCHITNDKENKNDYPACTKAVENARNLLMKITGTKYTNEGTVDVADIKTELNTAISKLKVLYKPGDGSGTRHYDEDAQYKAEVNALNNSVEALQPLKVTKTKDAVKGREAVAAVYKQAQRFNEEQQKELDTAFADIEAACETSAEESEKKGQGARIGLDVAAGVVGAGATALLAHGIVSSAQKAKYESAENEAIKEWMDNIGSKIHCYIGGELVGDFGDIVTVNIDE